MEHLLRCHEIFKTDFVRGENCFLYDSQGRRYVDLESGIWCTALGHCHPRLNQLMHAQIAQLVHLGTRYPNTIAEEAAQDVLEIIGFSGGKCVFLSSGSEAVEFGVQVARRISEKPLLLTFATSYLGAYGSSGRKSAEEWHLFDWRDCATCLHPEKCETQCSHVNAIPFDRIGAFVFEPGGSSPGFVHFPPQLLVDTITRRTKQENRLIVVNEITTGMGRTGKWFGFQHYDISPDIVCLGKGLGNGYPVSAVAMRSIIADKLEKSGFGYVQSHQNDPLGCAIAMEVIAIMNAEGWIEKGRQKGQWFLDRLQRLQEKHPVIQEVRGRGMLLAIEFNDSRPDISATTTCLALLDRGFLVGYYPAGNILRLDPSLTIGEEDLTLFLENLDQILGG